MICDAHIHVGYYNRKGHEEPFYYSPRRICTVLKKCGVDEFIYSSTSMQTFGIDFGDVNREMFEVQKIFGKGAHPFLWVTKRYHFANPSLSDLQYGFYEGVKLHGLDGSQWITENAGALDEVLSVAEKYNKLVMIHTGREEDARPSNYLPFILKHPNLRFILAHGRPAEEVEECMGASINVFADMAYMDPDVIQRYLADGLADRLLWGSDFPTYAAISGRSLTNTMREDIRNYNRLAERIDFAANFRRYLTGKS